MKKLDHAEFDLKLADYEDKLETITFATYDNYRVIKQTDNFVEKYLPFQLQNIISKNILSFLQAPPKPYFDTIRNETIRPKDMREWTPMEQL